MILLIDNYDSFTYTIYHYLLQCGLDVEVKRNGDITLADIETLNPEGLVLSPGPQRPADHPLLFQVLERYAAEKPILGICLGHQAIGEFYGAELVCGLPVHGKTSRIHHNGHAQYAGLPVEFEVCRYHSLSLQNIPEDILEVTASTADGIPMSLAHKQYRLWGIQYHPEAILTENGLTLLRNWAAFF